jgi:hypothetical protein
VLFTFDTDERGTEFAFIGSPPFPWKNRFVEEDSRQGATTQSLDILGRLPLCNFASLRQNSVKSTQNAENPVFLANAA